MDEWMDDRIRLSTRSFKKIKLEIEAMKFVLISSFPDHTQEDNLNEQKDSRPNGLSPTLLSEL